MTIEMQKLKYAEDALEPHISAEVIKYHYHKHTKRYFDTANELMKGTVYEGRALEDLVNKDSLTSMGNKLLNNVCQAYNHTFYWNCLAPEKETGEPSAELKAAIMDDFETFDKFKKEFTEQATSAFGSAWMWLYYRDGKLYLRSMPNAGTPLTTPKQIPLLVCDVWEHAHYTQYPADRAAYVKAFWSVVNWDFVNENYKKARGK